MIQRLVIFGGTGDLAGRYLLPGLAALQESGHLDASFRLVCADLKDWDDEQFRAWAAAQLEQHAPNTAAEARRAITTAARYRRADIQSPPGVAATTAGEGPVAVYLALASCTLSLTVVGTTVKASTCTSPPPVVPG